MSESTPTPPPTAPPSAPPPVPASASAYEPTKADAGPAPTRFIDRVVGMRAVIAVALASVILGGLGGTLLGARTNGGDDRFGRGPGRFPGGQGGFPGGPGGPGQLQGQPGQQQGQQPGQPGQ